MALAPSLAVSHVKWGDAAVLASAARHATADRIVHVLRTSGRECGPAHWHPEGSPGNGCRRQADRDWQRPAILGRTPAPNAEDRALLSVVKVTFSEDVSGVDADSMTSRLASGVESFPATVAYD